MSLVGRCSVAVVLAALAAGPVAVGLGAPAAGAATVVVQPGQTLSGLASAYGTTPGALAAANGIANPNMIFAGSRLLVPTAGATAPPATTGTVAVRAGDTLWGLARRLGTTVAALAAANGIADPNDVIAGTVLRVPGGSPAMSLASADLPLPAAPVSSGLPAQLRADPARIALLPVFNQWASEFGVPSSLLEAMCWWESGWQRTVVSPTGAVGIGQLEPATTAFVQTVLLHDHGLDPWVTSDNIEMSAAFLGYLLQRTGGNEALALAGYYQGLRSVLAHGLLPTTHQYVSGILAYQSHFAA